MKSKNYKLPKTSKEVMDSWDSYIDYLRQCNNIGPDEPFKPCVWYNKTGDLLEVYWNDDPHWAKWINKDITLFISFDTEKVVGCQIWGASSKITKDNKCGECVYESHGAEAVTSDMGVCAKHMNNREDQIHNMYKDEIKKLREELKRNKTK